MTWLINGSTLHVIGRGLGSVQAARAYTLLSFGRTTLAKLLVGHSAVGLSFRVTTATASACANDP